MNCWALRKVLTEKWDLIILHQYSQYATSYDQWLTKSDNGYLPQLTIMIHSLQPHAMLGTYIVHSYGNGYKFNYEGISYARWKNISNAVRRMTMEFPAFLAVIPYGTAIQNLHSSYSDASGMDMTRDGTHLGYGLARFTASVCLFQTLFSKRYGVSVNDIHFSYKCTEDERNQYSEGCTDMTEENLQLALSSTLNACNNPYGM